MLGVDYMSNKKELWYCHKCDENVDTNDFTYTQLDGNVLPVPVHDKCGGIISVYDLRKEDE
jgi:NAD-dependent SIR2 family protein deacetylase